MLGMTRRELLASALAAAVGQTMTSKSAADLVSALEEIIDELTLGLQECGRRLAVFLHKRHRELEAARKRSYMELYIPHLALGLKNILGLTDKEEHKVVGNLKKMLEKTQLDV